MEVRQEAAQELASMEDGHEALLKPIWDHLDGKMNILNSLSSSEKISLFFPITDLFMYLEDSFIRM
jgi:hypothetical protein